MLLFDLRKTGNKLLIFRKEKGLTQADVAEAAGLSDRTYADIERGTVNMRIETLLRICKVLRITPDDVLTENNADALPDPRQLFQQLNTCNPKEKETALKILDIYLHSL